MKLNRINTSCASLETDDNYRNDILFSYGTPVAFSIRAKVYIPTRGQEPYMRSVTTAKHINQWADGRDKVEVDPDEWSRCVNSLPLREPVDY